MVRNKDIVDNAVNSADHTTLVSAVKAAGLVETLKGSGPFTVFAPTNAAFSQLPEGTVAMLLEPQNKEQLGKVLTYHVVAGRLRRGGADEGDQEGERSGDAQDRQRRDADRDDERRPQHRRAGPQGRRRRHLAPTMSSSPTASFTSWTRCFCPS